VAWEYEGVLNVVPKPDQNYSAYVDYYLIPDRFTVADLAESFLIPAHKETILIDYAKGMLDAREKDWESSDRVKTDFLRKARAWEIKSNKSRYARPVTLIELQRQYNETYNGGKW